MAALQIESDGPDGLTALRPFAYAASESLVEGLDRISGALLTTTSQASRLVAVGVSRGAPHVTIHHFDRAMGLAVAPDRIAVGGGPQIWFLQGVPQIAPGLEPRGQFDGCFVTRSSHVTGEIHSHDLAFAGLQLWFVNTLFS